MRYTMMKSIDSEPLDGSKRTNENRCRQLVVAVMISPLNAATANASLSINLHNSLRMFDKMKLVVISPGGQERRLTSAKYHHRSS